jgi:Tfp pilus assembly protein PilO
MTDVRRIVSEHRRVVYLLVIALLVNIALYALVVFPLSQRVQNGEQQAGEATRELVAAQRTYNSARGTVTGKKDADTELVKFYQEVLPTDLSGARRALYPRLVQLAASAGLTTGRSSFDQSQSQQQDRTDNLRRLGMTLSISGEYSNVRRFIHELETAPEFLVLEHVAVTSGEDRDLNVTARVATYYRAEHDN